MLDSQPADELPPPAYELSQETFDQKTQQGIQASLSVPADVQEQWEVWDEAEFEANAHSTADASSSSSSSVPAPPVTAQQYPKEKTPRPPSPPTLEQEEPAVRPLRIVKKSQTAAYQKAVEASSYQSNKPASSTDEGGPLSRSFSVLSAGRRTPPPVFEPFGPSYDGPDYDEVTYVPGNSRPSSPMSVLSADSYRSPPPRPNMLVPPPPPPPIQHQPAPKPPMHTQAQRPPRPQYPPRRRVGFDPMSAYKPKSVFTPGLEPTPERVDPASFYNSAVSAHLSPIPQRPTVTPTYRTSGMYQQGLQHPQPHHATTFDSFSDMGNVSMGRERTMSVVSADSSYYPSPPVNLTPNRGWVHQTQPLHPNR